MAITDVLAEIKNYFLNWHTNNYVTLHTKETNQVTDQSPDKDYLVHSGAIKAAEDAIIQGYTNADTNLQNQINDINNNKLPKKANNDVYANVGSTNGIASYQDDWRGFNPKASGDCHNGLMKWQDKAQLLQLGIWYEVKRAQHASLGEHMTLWVNPAMRICYLKFYYKNFPVNKWDNIYSDSAEWDWYSSSSDHFLDNCAPISNIWAATNVPHINIGIDTTARFYVRSSEKITKSYSIYGSLFWFYRDDNIYSRWTK